MQHEFHRGEKVCLGAKNPCSSPYRDIHTQGQHLSDFGKQQGKDCLQDTVGAFGSCGY